MPEAYILIRIKDGDEKVVRHGIRAVRAVAHAIKGEVADFSVIEGEERAWIPTLTFEWLKAIMEGTLEHARNITRRRRGLDGEAP